MKIAAVSTPSSRQRGAVSLFVSLVLLVAITMVAFFANRSLVFEQKTSANEYRATKALQAAEAGLEWTLAQLNSPVFADATCAVGGTKTFRQRYLNPTVADPATYTAATGTFSAAQPACTRQSNGTWSCACPVETSTTVAAPACDLGTGACAKFKVQVSRVQDPALAVTCLSAGTNCVKGAVKITSIGYTDTNGTPDGTAAVSQILKTVSGLSSPPGAAVTARTNVDFSGSVDITNLDPATNGITIDAGGSVALGGSADVVTLPGSPPAASIITNDSSLSTLPDPQGTDPNKDAMFKMFFGMSKADYKNLPTTKQITCSTCGNSEIEAALAAGARTIWVNGDLHLNSNGTYGSATDPVVIIVTGNIRINGNVDITGLMYSASAAWDNSGGGSSSICGAAVAEGSMQSTGTPNPTYCADVLRRLRLTSGAFAKVPGSWRDF